jgi:hypothetical protein
MGEEDIAHGGHGEMKEKPIIRVFPRRTSHTPRDSLAFVGDPPLFRPAAEEVSEVHVSVSFTWDLDEAHRLKKAWAHFYPKVKIGGPAFGALTGTFVPGRYIKPGVTFTTRGCNRKCPWCKVPEREGRIVEVPDYPPGWIVQDNNFLQASQTHQAGVFDMLRELRERDHPLFGDFMASRGVEFAGGIDCRLVTPWFAEQLHSIRLFQVFLAADTKLAVRDLEGAREVLRDFSRLKMRVYTLIGFGNDTIEKATERLERVWDLECIPHAQLYQPADRWIDYSPDWRRLARTWSRPASMYGMHKATPEAALGPEQSLFSGGLSQVSPKP